MALSVNELELNDLLSTRQGISHEQRQEKQVLTEGSCNSAMNCTENHTVVQENPEWKLPEELGKKWCSFIFAGLICYFLDIGTDIYVAIDLYLTGKKTYFILTLIFIIPSSLVTNVLSLMFYCETRKNRKSPPIGLIECVFKVIVCCIQLGPALRYIDTYRYGCKSKKETRNREKKRMYDAMTYERADVALIRLLECFLEAAPQMVLQIYIMVDLATSNGSSTFRSASCVVSLLAFSFSIMGQQRVMRLSQDSVLMSWPASFVQFFSYISLILCRVMTFGLFASYSVWALLIVCGLHYAVVTSWIFTMKTELSKNKCLEIFFKFLFGIAYVFCYINLERSETGGRQTLFHIITFSENVCLTVIWCLAVDAKCAYIGLLLVVSCHAFGLISLVAYYCMFHPNAEKIRSDTRKKFLEYKKNFCICSL